MYTKEELLEWQAFYKKRANDESLSDTERMYAMTRLTNIAYALKQLA